MARPQRCVLVTAEASLQAPDAAAAAQVPVRRLGSRSAATARAVWTPSLRLRRSRSDRELPGDLQLVQLRGVQRDADLGTDVDGHRRCGVQLAVASMSGASSSRYLPQQARDLDPRCRLLPAESGVLSDVIAADMFVAGNLGTRRVRPCQSARTLPR